MTGPDESRRTLGLGALVLLLLLGTGCGAAFAPEPAPASSVLRDEHLVVELVAEPTRHVLVFRSGAGAGDTVVARAFGVHLRLADMDRPVLVPFVDAVPEGDGLRLRCEPQRDHEIEVRIGLAGPGEAHVLVTDEVSLRSRVLELSIAYEMAAPGPADEAEVPLLHPEPGQLAGDRSFRAPVGYARCGAKALAVMPDLDLLGRERRLPQGLELDQQGAVILRHGLCAQRAVADGNAVRLTRQGAEPIEARGERLAFAHHLRVTDGARPLATLAEMHRALWRRHAAPSMDRAAEPLGSRTWDQLCAAAVERFLREGPGDGPAEGPAAGELGAEAAEAVLFGVRRQWIGAACGVDLFADRVGRPGGRRAAARALAVALAAPRRGGLLPAVRTGNPATGQVAWRAGTTAGGRPGDYYAADSATTGYWLLQLAERVPERRDEVLAACAEMARFFGQNQAADGSIAGLYEGEFLSPVRELGYDQGAETAGPALFLAAYAKAARDPEARAKAERALRFLVREVQPRAAWSDLRSAGRSGTTDSRSRVQPRRAQNLVLAARAALLLAESDARFRPAAESLLDQLCFHQQVWSPTFVPPVPPGGLGDANTDLQWGAPCDALAAEAFLRGYRLTGRRDFLQRGAQALRAGLVGETALGPLGPLGSVVTVVERVRRDLGQAVVDVGGAFGEGLDAVWFEDVAVDGDRISFRLLTRAEFQAPVRVSFRNLREHTATYQLTVNGSLLGSRPALALGQGIDLWPKQVGRIRFTPPTQIRAGATWTPRAEVQGPMAADARVEVQVFTDRPNAHSIRLWPGGENGQELRAESDFVTAGLEPGAEILTRLVLIEHGRLSQVPAEGFHAIRVAEMDCLDPGDDGDFELSADGAAMSTVERFVDGRENGRAARGSAHFSYRIPIQANAAAVDLVVRLTGGVRIQSDDLLLHEDRTDVGEARDLVLALADPRLWRDEGLRLRFAPIDPEGDGICVARIQYLAHGFTAAVGSLGTSEGLRSPDPRLRILVVPVTLADAPRRTSRDDLQQAFFGGPGYRVTPAPNSRLTAGSVARLVQWISGGVSELHGETSEPIACDLLAADARRDPETTASGIAQLISERWSDELRRPRPRELDAVFAVHSGGPLPGRLDGGSVRLGGDGRVTDGTGLPLIFLAEQSEDGSILSSSRGLLALLETAYGLPRLSAPEEGNFGDLALSADGNGHIPSGLAGINLIQTGWADLLSVSMSDPDGQRPQRMELSPLLGGHTLYRLACDELPDRGELLLEARGGSDVEPALGSFGVLLYWHREGARPLVQQQDGRSCRARIIRLSPVTASLATPFTPGSAADLFRSASSLDGSSVPSIATPEGDVVWAIEDLRAAGNAMSLDLRYLGVDLLELDRAGNAWATGLNGGFGPLSTDGIDRGVGTVAELGHGFAITSRPTPGASVRGTFELPGAHHPRRLFGRLERLQGSGSAWLRILVDDRELLGAALDPDEQDTAAFQIEIEPLERGARLTVELIHGDGRFAGDLTRLLLVPKARSLHDIKLHKRTGRTVRLMDGVHYTETQTVSVGQDGRTVVSVPVVLPTGGLALRIHAGVPWQQNGALPLRLTATLRARDGSRETKVIGPVPIGTGTGREPLLLALAEIPPSSTERVALLDLMVEGTPERELHFVSLTIERP